MEKYSGSAKQEIRSLLRSSKDTRMYKKYLVIQLHMKGLPNTRIAEIVGIDRQTAGIYITNYKANGVEGLIPKKPPGRPRFLALEQEKRLYEVISNNTPDDMGFEGVMNWTAKLACLWVFKEFGVQYKRAVLKPSFCRTNFMPVMNDSIIYTHFV